MSASVHHVLLIGVDAYSAHPLDGCVNDIDAIQRVLLATQGGIRAGDVVRLASPRAHSTHEVAIPERPATSDNIRAAFSRLTSEAVEPDHRVFIYYSGHGMRSPVLTSAGTLWREALVAADYDELQGTGLLYDFELNSWLAAIVARTRAVTFVLDCCHSAGATRDLPASNGVPRFMPPTRGKSYVAPASWSVSNPIESRGMGANVDACQVVAACLNHELAYESTLDGRIHGHLTRALVAELEGVPVAERHIVPWGLVWHRIRRNVAKADARQHVWITGGLARPVFGGPPIEADVGLTVQRVGGNSYEIGAGTLAGVGSGAEVAVYAASPLRFPPLGSSEDSAARCSPVALRVTTAEYASSIASAAGLPFEIPPGARGRLIALGERARLRCAVVPQDSAVCAALASSGLLALVDVGQEEACLRREGDGTWALLDDIHGAAPDFPALHRFSDARVARAVLEHYQRYSLALRMAVAATDLAGALRLEVLKCPSGRELTVLEQDGVGLQELACGPSLIYDALAGDRAALRVKNAWHRTLKVTILNAAASGKVQFLGEQSLEPGAIHLFWFMNNHGLPFELNPPSGTSDGVDRVLAIGTTNLSSDLHFLEVTSTFAEVATRRARSDTRDLAGAQESNSLLEWWTATQVMIRCRARLA